MVVADTLVSLGVLVSFYALIALGLNIKYGHTGLLDFGHVAFFLVGAYTAALVTLPVDEPGDFTKYLIGLDLPWVVGALAAMVLAGIIGAFVALPTLRLREDYLAITLLGVAVIFQRVVQAETWIANGPDSLRGIHRPLAEFFPVSSQSVDGALASVFIAAGIWALMSYLLSLTLEKTEAKRTWEDTLVRGLHRVATFGTERWFDARGRQDPVAEPEHERGIVSRASPFNNPFVASSIIAGGLVGIISGLLTLISPSGMLIWGVVVSALTWLVLLAAVRRATRAFASFDYLLTLALGVAYMLTLAPVFFLESDVTGIPLTLIAVAVVLGATVYLRRTLSVFNRHPLKFGALTGMWFGLVWYFPLQILSDLQAGDIWPAATTVFNNIVWVLSFDEIEPLIGYSRFLLFLFGAVAIAAVFVSDLIVDSPFGRVLRAIRNDEQVVNSLGKDPFMYKVQSMAIGSALAGLAGALAAMYYQTLVFTMFSPEVTFIAFLMVFLGGVANNRGMLVGAAIFWVFQTATVQLTGFVEPALSERVQAFRLVIMGVLFLLLLYYRPQGLLAQRSAAEVQTE